MPKSATGPQAGERLARLLDGMQAGVMIVDSGLNVLYVNARMREYFPCRTEEWENLSVGDFLGCGGREPGAPYRWKESCGSCSLCGRILGMIRRKREMWECFFTQAYLHKGREEEKWYQVAGILAGPRADCAALFFSDVTGRVGRRG